MDKDLKPPMMTDKNEFSICRSVYALTNLHNVRIDSPNVSECHSLWQQDYINV